MPQSGRVVGVGEYASAAGKPINWVAHSCGWSGVERQVWDSHKGIMPTLVHAASLGHHGHEYGMVPTGEETIRVTIKPHAGVNVLVDTAM